LQSAYPIEILCLNEHWLSPNDIDVLSIDNYTVASSFCRSKYKHGGVAILIHNSLKLWQSLNTVQYCEVLHCEIAGIAFNGCRLYTIYRPPAGNFDLFIEKLEFLLQSIVGKSYIITTGDFNCKFNTSEKQAVTLVNTFISFGLQQAVFLPIRQHFCLDNIFTNIREDKFSIEVFNPALSDHSAVCMSFFQPTTQNATIEKAIFHRPITEHGLFTLYNIIENTDWSFIDNNCERDSEHLFETFLGTIAHNVNVCFPLIKIQPKHGTNI
jgi:hypothetical protein